VSKNSSRYTSMGIVNVVPEALNGETATVIGDATERGRIAS
jgi:hypothetical protein